MSEETLRIIIPAVTALLGIVLGAFLQRWNDNRKRKLDRRAATYDKRLQEAREYVDAIAGIIVALMGFNDVFKKESTLEIMAKRFDDLSNESGGLHSLMDEAPTKMDSIIILNDTILTALNNQLTSYFREMQKWSENSANLTRDVAQQNREKVYEFLEVLLQANDIVVQMKARLDKLAQKVP